MKKTNNKKWIVASMLLLLCLISLQFVKPQLSNPPVTQTIVVPANIEKILRRSCFDCHSNETKLQWFDQIMPAYWLVASHVKDGRNALNFSEWDKLSEGERKGKLYLSLNDILTQEMPRNDYLLLHPQAKVTTQEIEILKDYLRTLSPRKEAAPSSAPGDKQSHPPLIHHGAGSKTANSVAPAPNGIDYIPEYSQWKAISTTDRFDNGTMRVIYGNDIAIQAIKNKKINPWPEGTMLAKAAWEGVMDSAAVIRPGEFVQVEFMIKDSKKYAATKGWGWARWKGKDLKSYGKNAIFTTECISCHRPWKDNDYVFTLPLNLSKK